MLKHFQPHVTGRTLCLQAGGGVGEYPSFLSRHFERVVTVEASKANFDQMLIYLAKYKNVTPIHAGLWDELGKATTFELRPEKPLTSYVVPNGEGGTELITIDSLGLEPDLIWLDLEGAEHKALLGALKTLETCRHVIIEEARKNLEENVGCKPGMARKLLISLGFTEVYGRYFDHLFRRD